MLQLAAIVGTFIGAVLKQCGPVLEEIIAKGIKDALTDTVEDGARSPALRDRLAGQLRRLPPPGGADNPGASWRAGPTP
jgi:hypothetical protein